MLMHVHLHQQPGKVQMVAKMYGIFLTESDDYIEEDPTPR